jgi:hypothetical protein
VPGDIFEKDPFRGAFADDPGDVGPEVTGIIGPAALSSGTKGLAGISGEDDVEGTAEDTRIETAEIIPDWGWGEISCALGGDEDSARPVIPFDKSTGVIVGFGKHEAHIQASAACAEGQSMPGT